MSTNARSLLETVRQLLSEIPHDLPTPEKDARYRIVVSKAYYAAFWATRDYLLEKEGEVPEHNVHHAVRLAFRGKKPPESVVNHRLRVMFEDRVRADYQPEETFIYENALTACEDAKELLRLLDQMTIWMRQRNPSK